jgi:hypothetical protein
MALRHGLHADLGGRIQANKREAVRLAEDMKHVEAVLKMFDPEFNARAIAARRRVTALEAMRSATGPLTVRELADAVLAAKGITDATAKQHEMLQQAFRSSLGNNAGKTVERVGEGIPMRWRIIRAAS